MRGFARFAMRLLAGAVLAVLAFIAVGGAMSATSWMPKPLGQVSGIVWVDAPRREDGDGPPRSGCVRVFWSLSRVAAAGAGAGLFKPLMYTNLGDLIGLPPAATAEKRWAFASGRHARWAAEEV